MWTLQQAADFIRTRTAPAPLLRLICSTRRLISFRRERLNRPPRFVAVVNEYRRGTLVQDIENKFGCSKTTIMRYARMAEISKRERGFDPNIRRATIAMYQLGRPVAEISAALGVSQAYVSKTATDEGISRRRFKKRTPSQEAAQNAE